MVTRHRHLFVSLAAGAAVTLALAWVPCVTVRQGRGAGVVRTRATTVDLPGAEWPHGGGTGAPTQFMRTASWRFTSDFAMWARTREGGGGAQADEFAIDVVRAGLPFRCLECRFEGEWMAGRNVRSEFTRSIAVTTSFASAMLPCKPVWLGMAGDVGVFAGVIWMAWRGPRMAREWWRARRNRCAGCGYDRAGIGAGMVCPECGVGSKA